MVNFNRTQLVDYILSTGIKYGNVVLTISGKLSDETIFEGSTTITVSNLVGDVNCDGKVNIYDATSAASSYNSREGEPKWNPNANFAPPWDRIDLFDLVTIISNYGKS